MSENPCRTLVVGPAWVGDMVMAQSLYKTLKQIEPQCEIDVVAPAWSQPLLARMPEVHNAVELPVGHGNLNLSVRYRIGKKLRKRAYQKALIMPRSFKSALIPFFAKVPQRTGYRGETRYGLINDMRMLDKNVLTQTVQRYVALGCSADKTGAPSIIQPKLKVDKDNQRKLIKNHGIVVNVPTIGIMPGAEYGFSKQWPTTYYSELASNLAKQGVQILVFGSVKERDIGEQIAANNSDRVLNLCGKTRLEDVVDLLSLPAAVVTNDSGLMHVAAAVDSHVIALYGSSTPDYTPPLTDKATIFYQRLDCSPCFKRECPYGHTHCLTNISVPSVLQAVNKLIN